MLQLLALLAALTLFAAACQGDDPEDDTDTDLGEATEEEEAPAEDEPTEEEEEAPATDEATEEEAVDAGSGDNSFSLYIGEPESLLPPNSNESEG
ncbi:MAG TPA: hypothetical protein VMM13_03830, partial [Euzebya sp.]|nr:hypothetical protein [Euzebya sp.]